jgi:hypothetical protein
VSWSVCRKATASSYANADRVEGPKEAKPPRSGGGWLSRIALWLAISIVSIPVVLIVVFIGMQTFFILETPPILRFTGGPGGWDDGCPSDREGVVPVPLSKVALSPDFTERLTKAFPTGTPSAVVEKELTRQGFTIPVQHTCTNDPDVKTAFFTLHTFGSFRGTAYWKIDAHGNVVWTRGIVDEYLKLARFRGQCEIGGQAAVSMYRRSNSTGEMNPIDV